MTTICDANLEAFRKSMCLLVGICKMGFVEINFEETGLPGNCVKL